MPDDPTEQLCINCLAERIASNVLGVFGDAEPDISMPYGAWMTLGAIIEDEVKKALGVEEEADKPPATVQ